MQNHMSSIPKISIGMPAYNSAATIGVSIKSLLEQSFGDFELIVSDNASTDSTREIVEGLAQLDRRIRYVCQPENVGANRNYSCCRAGGAWSNISNGHLPAIGAHRHSWRKVLDRTRSRMMMQSLRHHEPDCLSWDLTTATDYAYDIEVLDFTPVARLVKIDFELARSTTAVNGLIRMKSLRRTRLLDPFYMPI